MNSSSQPTFANGALFFFYFTQAQASVQEWLWQLSRQQFHASVEWRKTFNGKNWTTFSITHCKSLMYFFHFKGESKKNPQLFFWQRKNLEKISRYFSTLNSRPTRKKDCKQKKEESRAFRARDCANIWNLSAIAIHRWFTTLMCKHHKKHSLRRKKKSFENEKLILTLEWQWNYWNIGDE